MSSGLPQAFYKMSVQKDENGKYNVIILTQIDASAADLTFEQAMNFKIAMSGIRPEYWIRFPVGRKIVAIRPDAIKAIGVLSDQELKIILNNGQEFDLHGETALKVNKYIFRTFTIKYDFQSNFEDPSTSS
jgi:hypothetical protein